MNTVFGKADQYGVRSRYICAFAEANHRIEVFSRGIAKGEDGTIAHVVRLPLRYQALRYSMAILRQKPIQRRSIWRGFDARLCRTFRDLDITDAKMLHTWEWIPETIAFLKERNPGLKIVRDVVVNRYNEFYSGTPITEEEPLTDLFISPSTYSTKCLLDWGIPADKIVEIPFGVDTNRFRPDVSNKTGPIRFAFSGGVSRRKGIDSLLRVWKRLGLVNAELHLYGRVRTDVARDLKGTDNVVCHGHVPLSEELPKNHVFVFPSRLEGSAKSVYEALACGLPVITTPNSGSVVRHGIDGLIVDCDDDDGLMQAMIRLYRDEKLRIEYGSNARARAEKYTWERYARSVWETYDRIVPGHGLIQ